jgi:O-antigen ligase
MLADTAFWTRQQTTTSYQEDSTAQQRLESWRGGFELVKDHPFGTGGRGYHLLSGTYIAEIVASHDGEPRAPHNTYVMVASEWGVAGLILYLGFIASTFVTLSRVKARSHGQDFFYWRALAIQLALIGAMVAGVFVDRLYGEALYWMSALAYALCRIQCTEHAEAGASARLPVAAAAAA